MDLDSDQTSQKASRADRGELRADFDRVDKVCTDCAIIGLLRALAAWLIYNLAKASKFTGGTSGVVAAHAGLQFSNAPHKIRDSFHSARGHPFVFGFITSGGWPRR
jgi:hypothetical protein